jgi:hypothetical protein
MRVSGLRSGISPSHSVPGSSEFAADRTTLTVAPVRSPRTSETISEMRPVSLRAGFLTSQKRIAMPLRSSQASSGRTRPTSLRAEEASKSAAWGCTQVFACA